MAKSIPRSATHRSQADEMQQRTRTEMRFLDTEAHLPKTTQRSTLQTLNPLARSGGLASKIPDLLSFFGSRNPLPVAITKKDCVWLMDNVAYKSASTGRWEAEFVACAFSQEASCDVLDAVNKVAHKIDLPDDDPAFDTIGERIQPFLQEILPGRQVRALHGDSKKTKLVFSPGGRNGISSDIRRLPASPAGKVVPTTAEVPKGATGLVQMKTFFAEPEGWAVISDIDDTIKITQTSDPIGILRTTFTEEPTPTKGLPELYKYIQSLVTESAPFFYLSASPYNLYPFLRNFRDEHFPHGQLILRDASWMSIPGLLSNLTMGTQEYKVNRIEKVHTWLPKRKMILIGDSTQSDPESYGDIYRKFPGWVGLILIRKVTDIAAVGIKSKNEPERFEKAFKDVPKPTWHVFEEASECYQIVQDTLSL